MTISFHKMHGLGNDFIVIDAREQLFGKQYHMSRMADTIRLLADRRFGIGCDQLLVLRESDRADVLMQIFNPDGEEVGACGNATRCIAWLESQNTGKSEILIETKAGQLYCEVSEDGLVHVDMGAPLLSWHEIPMAEEMDTLYVPHGVVGLPSGVAVSMGNPHIVIFVEDVGAVPLEEVGAMLEHSPLFPERVNVTIAQLVSRDRIVIKVWERGAGATLACGTAACATLVAARRRDIADSVATIILPGGTLTIGWNGSEREYEQPVLMTGSVSHICTGQLSEGVE